jgi:type III restriction enzyme
LHKQSKEKLEKYLEQSRALKCKFFEDLSDRNIGENEVLFFNWESINKENKNTIVKENEEEFYLSKVLELTREEGRKIILIVDESHYAAGARDEKGEQAANKLRGVINADLTIEVSATPILKGDDDVNVQIEEVKAQGMIKKAVILNDGCRNIKKGNKIKSELSAASDELVIDKAIKKKEELLKAFQKEKVDINPLILIQLPDKIGSLEDRAKERVISILKNKYNISTEKDNNKLAIWLSGEHVNKEDVEKQDSEIQVLIFKQAIALGWDCPRAQILVLFREWHSPVFSIQTVGRIMRMPEPDKGHYESEILNYGYVFTNIEDVEIREDIARNYISSYPSKIKDNYKLINLLSYYSIRHREKTRLKPLFIEIFLTEAEQYNLKEKIDVKEKKIDMKIIADAAADNIDRLAGKKFIGDKSIKLAGFDLQRYFDYFVRERLQSEPVSFYPEDRSVDNAKEAILRFFEKELNMDFGDGQDIVLMEKNKKHFVNVFERAKESYKKEVIQREEELGFIENWNIPEKLTFADNYVEEERQKSIMQPFYVQYGSGLEEAFVDFLEESESVEWWFKNGDRDATFFAVPYENGEKKPFYVDFIVKLKDGRIALLDPHGVHLSDFKTKSDGLLKYLRDENKKGKKLFGGIVTNTDPRKYKGRWIYFDKPSRELKDNNFDNWENLEL